MNKWIIQRLKYELFITCSLYWLIHSESGLCHFQEGRKEGNVLFNDALNTFYLRLYGVGHMIKDHSDFERENPLPPHRLLLVYVPSHRQDSTACRGAQERDIAQWVHHEGSIRRPIAQWVNALTTELSLSVSFIHQLVTVLVKYICSGQKKEEEKKKERKKDRKKERKKEKRERKRTNNNNNKNKFKNNN